jgi:hypothetical protein
MKKVITALLALAIGIIVLGPTHQAEAQPVYCSACCGTVNGTPVIGCGLVAPIPCGNPCWCSNVPGQGFGC